MTTLREVSRRDAAFSPTADQLVVLTANSTRSLSILVYQEAFSFQRAGSGASLALIVTLIVTVLAVIYISTIRRGAVA